MRCIKPNAAQVANTFDAGLTLHQLRCCGVLEVTRIARAGYPTRYAHAQFAHRYSVLLGNKAPRAPLSPHLPLPLCVLTRFSSSKFEGLYIFSPVGGAEGSRHAA